MEMNNDIFTPDLPIPEPVGFEDAPIPAPAEEEKPVETPPPRRRRKADASVLTIESGDEIETEDAREAAAWHEIHNAYRTRRILSAPLGGIEQTDSGKTIAVVDYNGFRIAIPLKEMMVAPTAANSTDSMAVRQMKLLGNMLGAEIDFVILGIDSKSRSVVASRREAMMRKRQLFYFSPDANGEYRVREGRVVQARVIAVADKSIRVEIFGVECSIMARDLAWDWIGDAHDRFAVGDQILVRVTEVNKTSQEELSVHADVKSVTENTSREALKRCRVQSKYAGRVTDVHKGIVYVRLSNGVNAVAHSCYDRRTPGKKDDVSFVVTKLDEERSIAVGIITRIIRQNLQEEFKAEYGLSTDALFVDSEVNKSGNRLENYARALERSKKMMQIIDTAIDLMRRKHKKGEFYYWILYYAYLSPQQCENAGAILQALESKGISISLRTYYVHRDEAIEVLSSILWGYTSQDCERITNLLTPD